MANITKRGNSYRVTISLYNKGVYKRETKTFKDKKDAELWALEMELEKGRGKILLIVLPNSPISIEIGWKQLKKMK